MPQQDNSFHLPPLLAHATQLAGVVLCIFLIWASVVEVDEAVKGNGRTIPSGQNKVIQHLEGGIVADILVQEGQLVDTGQLLFRIENKTTTATLRENEILQKSLEASIMRLTSEIEDAPLVFPEEMKIAMPDVVRNEMLLFASRKQQRAEALRILNDQIEQKKRSLEEQTSKVTNLKRELATAKQQFSIIDGLQKAGATSANRVLDAKAKADRFTTELSTTIQTIPITQAELNEAESRLAETRSSQTNELLAELHKASLDNQQLLERLKGDRDKSIRTDVAAPVKGIVNRLYIHTIGGSVRSGEILAEITPLDDNVIVEAKIAPEHRAKIWTGQNVKVKITAYEYATYGTIPGIITDISADSFLDEQTKAPFYRVKVTLDRNELSSDKKIMPGMMTEVNILTGKRTIMDYLLRPLMRIKDDAFKE
jgi:membrane fusion protein, adhesin transport system